MKKIFASLLLGILGLSLTGCTRYGTYQDADKYLMGNQTYSESIASLDIDWVSGSLTLVEDANIQGVKVEEETTFTDEKELVHSYLNNGELKIKFFASGHVRNDFAPFKKDLTITYHPGLNDLDIDLTSGTFKAETLTSDKVGIHFTSGSADIGTIAANEVNVSLTSGDFAANHVSATRFDSDMTSGSMNIGFDSVNKASFDLTSGNIDMALPANGGKVKIHKTSGSVNTVRECSVNNDIYSFGEGTADIEVEMTSGRLTIR